MRIQLLCLVLLACHEGGDTGMACEPVPTWSAYAEPVLLEHCQPCHASTSPNRYGAPTHITFDDETQTRAFASCIEETALSESPTMPPAVPVSELDKRMLETWLWCVEE